MKTFDQAAVSDLLTKNYINRNDQISVFVRLLNTLQDSQILAIDGAWGSGKTIFVKQLDLLCDADEMPQSIPSVDSEDIQTLRSTYTSIYYNAWENDYFDDALQSILYNLVAKIDKTSGELNANSQKKALSKFKPSDFTKNITRDLIDPDGKTSDELSTAQIREVVDRKSRITNNLQQLVNKTDKRILFIIDELDRCSPTFAVKVLETIKHYFEIDGITFVLAINTEQLAHTVKKFYGNDFDGYNYLNKFFDFPFSLKEPDVKIFAANYLSKPRGSDIVTKTPIEVAHFLNLKMREVESYYKSLDMIDDYMQRRGFYDEENIEYLAQCVFVPLALGLKIRSGSDYRSFVAGDDAKVLHSFLQQAPDTVRFIAQFCRDKVLTTPGATADDAKKATINYAVSVYDDLFKTRTNRYAREAYDAFVDATNIIGYYTKIEEPNAIEGEK